jgi:hypothetical protein
MTLIGILWCFRGQFLDGKRTGKGTAVMSNKCRYTGERSCISYQISLKISTTKDVEFSYNVFPFFSTLSGNDNRNNCNDNNNNWKINDDDSLSDDDNNSDSTIFLIFFLFLHCR